MFTNEDNSGSGKFANFKDGKIVTKIDGQKKEFTTMTGHIVDMDISDEEYQGRKYRKVTLFISDKGTVCQLGFDLGSGYGWGFFQLCGNIDVKKPVSISGGTKEIPNSNGKSYGSMFIKQDGKYLQHLMKNGTDAAKKIPAVDLVKIGKQDVKDYSKRHEYMEKVLAAFFKKVQKQFPGGAGAEERAKAKSKEANAETMTEPIGDLPF